MNIRGIEKKKKMMYNILTKIERSQKRAKGKIYCNRRS